MLLRRRIAATGAALVMVAPVLGGCADDQQPQVEDPPTSATPSGSDTPAPERQTAEEFIREWVELDNEMQESGETHDFRAASRGCNSCQSYADRVEAIYAAGGSIRTHGRSVQAIRKVQSQHTYDVVVVSAPTRYRETDSAEVQRLPGGHTTYRLTLVRRNGVWVVRDEVEVSDS